MNISKQQCPMTYNVPPEMSTQKTYVCIGSRCAWWVEDAQKCAMLVLAESKKADDKGTDS